MDTQVMSWSTSLERLTAGNKRFVAGVRSAAAMLGHVQLKDLAEKGQKPFAIVLSCSDSRVPAELLFDCGFGELFVVRVAGNVIQPSQVASIEFAAKVLGAPLCVVMGHSKCGAVQAALDSETGKHPELGPNIDFLIELIRPSVEKCLSQKEANSVSMLDQSSLLRSLAVENRFKVVEAVFALETGEVVLN
jgi:carbonic anhydrase